MQLEVNLAESERQALEKELLVDQVTRLSKTLSEQAENCQEDRLSVAKKVDNKIHLHTCRGKAQLVYIHRLNNTDRRVHSQTNTHAKTLVNSQSG